MWTCRSHQRAGPRAAEAKTRALRLKGSCSGHHGAAHGSRVPRQLWSPPVRQKWIRPLHMRGLLSTPTAQWPVTCQRCHQCPLSMLFIFSSSRLWAYLSVFSSEDFFNHLVPLAGTLLISSQQWWLSAFLQGFCLKLQGYSADISHITFFHFLNGNFLTSWFDDLSNNCSVLPSKAPRLLRFFFSHL